MFVLFHVFRRKSGWSRNVVSTIEVNCSRGNEILYVNYLLLISAEKVDIFISPSVSTAKILIFLIVLLLFFILFSSPLHILQSFSILKNPICNSSKD